MGELSVLGLTATQERVFEVLVSRPRRTAVDLAAEEGLAPSEVTVAIERLQDLGLVVADAGDGRSYSVAPVELAVDALVRERREALDRAQALGRELSARAARSDEVHRPEQLVSVVIGREAMGTLSQQLQRSATREVLSFDRRPYLAPFSEQGGGIDPEQQARMAAGVEYRTVFDQSLLDDPVIVARIRRDAAAGERGRVLADLPLKLLVVDRTTALLPLLTGVESGPPAALLVRPSVLVDSLVALFEALWRLAAPLRLNGEPGDEQELRTVVGLLAAGLSDIRIGRTLGISERTVRRKVAALLAHLGVETRFQAALRARELGWL